METLSDILQFYSDNPRKWLYYNSTYLNLDDVLSDSNKALRFIIEYFGVGGKSETFIDSNIKRYKADVLNRSTHIVSTFFLGLKIADCIGIDVDNRDDNNMSFLYYWFLACLYHDIGYIYELHSSCEKLRMISLDGLEAIQESCDIKHLHNRVFKTYSRDIVDLYLKGRATCSKGSRGVIDHGIVGGLLLYDGLRKQFEKSWKKRINTNDSRNSFSVNINGRILHCSNEHYEEYAKAADAIIAHNIWINRLHEYLVDAGETNIKPSKICVDNTLCFILCLADTIEPLKRNSEYIDSVSFSFEKDQIFIAAPESIFKEVYDGISNLEGWLNVSVKAFTDNAVIKLNSREE